MIITLLAGLTLVAMSAALGARALAFGRIRAAGRLRSIEMYGLQPSVDPDSAEEASRAGIDRVAERVGGLAAATVRGLDLAQMRRDLAGAGFYRLTAEAYLGYRILAGATCMPLLVASAAKLPVGLGMLVVAVGGLLAWRAPSIVVQRRGAARNGEIDRELPELIDLLIVSIEAGVGLGAAQQSIAKKLEGPLGDELRLMLQEQRMGLSSSDSLSNLLERCETPAVWSFVRSLQQGERLGMSIGTILRNLADEMRTRRRQNAEERAQKAPVKMLFPLVFLIFPSMFIVLLGPAVFRFKDVFAGG